MSQKDLIGDPLLALSAILKKHGWRHFLEEGVIQSGSGGDGDVDYFPMTFSWVEECGLIHFVCGIELTVEDMVKAELDQFITEVNPTFYIGHFEHRPESGIVAYRYGLYVNQGENWEYSILQVLNTGVEACRVYAPAFKEVAAGVPAAAALKKLREAPVPRDEEERPRRLHS